ncbi:MAG: hypothetical protein ACRD1L_09810 [Terriglobales bacterium]
MTHEDVQLARAQRLGALRPAEITPAAMHAVLRELGCARLSELAAALGGEPEAAAAPLEAEIAERRAVELAVWPGEFRYCAAELLGYLYVCVGDRNPLEDYKRQAAQRQLSWLASEAFAELLASEGALTAGDLRARMGPGRISILALERSLLELARTLKVLRTGRAPTDGAPLWQPLARALPEIPGWVNQVSHNEAAAALLTQRLDLQVCESEEKLEEYFSPLLSRVKIRAALSGLEANREVTPDSLDGRSAWRLREAAAPAGEPAKPVQGTT